MTQERELLLKRTLEEVLWWKARSALTLTIFTEEIDQKQVLFEDIFEYLLIARHILGGTHVDSLLFEAAKYLIISRYGVVGYRLWVIVRFWPIVLGGEISRISPIVEKIHQWEDAIRRGGRAEIDELGVQIFSADERQLLLKIASKPIPRVRLLLWKWFGW